MVLSRAWTFYSVETDPTEAHVFDQNGTYLGETKQGSPIWLSRYYDWDLDALRKNGTLQYYAFPQKKEHWYQSSSYKQFFAAGRDVLIIKKRGYQDTRHEFLVNFYVGNEGLNYAKKNPQRVMVVLSSPSI
jgi:hypothetical protein